MGGLEGGGSVCCGGVGRLGRADAVNGDVAALRVRMTVEAGAPDGRQSLDPVSLPVPKFDVAEFLFDDAADPGRLFAQAAKLAERFEPRLVFASLNAQLFFQRL